MYLLDTDTLSLLQRGNTQINLRRREHDPEEVFASVINVEEQLSGWYKKLRDAKTAPQEALAYRSLAETVTFLCSLPLLLFTEPAIERFKQLLRLKLNVGKNDLRIAAIALENNAVVVTRNGRDFGRVPDLVIEDWTLPNA